LSFHVGWSGKRLRPRFHIPPIPRTSSRHAFYFVDVSWSFVQRPFSSKGAFSNFCQFCFTRCVMWRCVSVAHFVVPWYRHVRHFATTCWKLFLCPAGGPSARPHAFFFLGIRLFPPDIKRVSCPLLAACSEFRKHSSPAASLPLVSLLYLPRLCKNFPTLNLKA